ncbi:MAG TPA: hypothetical protein VFS51_13850 [Gemmatimonadales bacterium]|nr:hypothetical protein [Gemmatimonadales bacterium]
MPVKFKVVTQDGRSTREPARNELPLIKAFLLENGEINGVVEVPGVGDVFFMEQVGNGQPQ